ncbi:Guanosine-5'-triphosphate 3'-diphosphate pyrophosphatase [Euphorbia peplus]|nr:Guanosine-5'-triphosphate 3'-diphosphate pyrophosphatase [Euphorbia peplus]
MTSSNNLFATIDMGTNSFKLLIIQATPSGKFLTIDRHRNPICLGRHSPSSSIISDETLLRAIQCLRDFHQILKSINISPHHTRCVATAAIRGADNAMQLRDAVLETTGLNVDVLSGEEEARYVYLGVLQFLPVFDKRVLVVDIGGGSTEFVVGEKGVVVFGVSLNLGHVVLSQKFVRVSDIREFVRGVVKESGLIEKVKECGFDKVVGTSGTIKAIEKAVFMGYGHEHDSSSSYYKRDWKFSRGELNSVVDKLCEGERDKRDDFFKGRSEFIIAGAVLLQEIFELLNIEEMEVSAYALGEGVIAEKLGEVFESSDLNGNNQRWGSVVRLATRFSDKKRIKCAAECAKIANEIFEGLRKWMNAMGQDENNLHLDEKDLEYLEAACFLHNIGLCAGKKGYHKQTYQIIMNCESLHGYSTEEVKLIALLARYHRKKFPKFDHSTLHLISVETKERFTILCVIMRISVILQQSYSLNFKDVKVSHSREGVKLVLREANTKSGLLVGEDVENELRKELAHFRTVFQQPLFVEVLQCIED